MAEVAPQHPIEVWLRANQGVFDLALTDKELGFEPFMAAVIQDCIRSPKLLSAARSNPNSLKEALLACANAGLLPGSAYDQFYLVPFGNRVQGIVGYKGMCDMVYRHPRVHSIEAFAVYEDEDFDWFPANGVVQHKWNPKADRSPEKIAFFYAKANLTDPKGLHVVDKPIFWVMTRGEVDEVMHNSQAWRNAERSGKKDSPWHLHYMKMGRKTPIRHMVNGGAVPRHNTLAPLLYAEQAMDTPDRDAEPVEATTRTQQLKSKLNVEFPDDQEQGTPPTSV